MAVRTSPKAAASSTKKPSKKPAPAKAAPKKPPWSKASSTKKPAPAKVTATKKPAPAKAAATKKRVPAKAAATTKATPAKVAATTKAAPAKTAVSTKKPAKTTLPAPVSAVAPAPARSRKAPVVDVEEAAPERRMPRQREIAVSEFFSKNRHLLGFDSPQKALMTAVREAVDNALDACEEARILPDILVELTETGEGRYKVRVEDNGPGIPKAELGKIFGKLLYGSKFHRLKQSRGQQGIGISAAVMYGQMTTGEPSRVVSKLKGGRAQFIALTIDTAKNNPKIEDDGVEDSDWWKAKASGTSIEMTMSGQFKGGRHGVEAYLKQTALANPHARVLFQHHKAATKTQPATTETMDLPRVVQTLPKEPVEIKPHPHGVELGTFQRFLLDAGKQSVEAFLHGAFSRVTPQIARDVVAAAQVEGARASSSFDRSESERVYHALQAQRLLSPPTSCLSPIGEEALLKGLYALFGDAGSLEEDDDLAHMAAEKVPGKKELVPQGALVGEMSAAAEQARVAEEAAAASKKKTRAAKGKARGADKAQGVLFDRKTTTPTLLPTAVDGAPASAVSQLPTPSPTVAAVQIEKDEDGADVIVRGENVFVTAVTRPPAIYRGNPFQVECGLLYSKDLRADELAKVFRFANRVPLLYQASACAMTKAVVSSPWRSYEVQQSKGALPTGPLVILVHIASAWVPYTSESKEAIAHYPEVLKEMRLAIMEAGRRLQRFLRRRRREVDEQKKRDYITKYLDTIGEALQEILGLSNADRARTSTALQDVLEQSRTQAVSDAERKAKRGRKPDAAA